jgi:hypothetical protein
MHRPAACLGGARERLAIHDGVGDGLRAIVGNALLRCRRKFGAHAYRDVRDRHGHCCSKRREGLARTARGEFAYALDECQGVSERNRPCPRAVEVTTHRPRPLVVMRVGRQPGFGQLDAAAIQ